MFDIIVEITNGKCLFSFDVADEHVRGTGVSSEATPGGGASDVAGISPWELSYAYAYLRDLHLHAQAAEGGEADGVYRVPGSRW